MKDYIVVMSGIGDIKPYENNPRDNTNAIEDVARSLRDYGWQQPIVVDANNVIIAGHTRFEAAKLLGLDVVPIHIATDLTDEQVKQYRIDDNFTSEKSRWNWSKLEKELLSMDELQISWESLTNRLENMRKPETTSPYGNPASLLERPSALNQPEGRPSELVEEESLLNMRGHSFKEEDDKDFETTKSAKYLTIGKIQVPLTDLEDDMLRDALKQYADENGSYYGFVTDLFSV